VKRTSLVLALVLGLFMLFIIATGGAAFATNWVEVPESDGRLYVDADSVVKQGSAIIYWELLVYKPNDNSRSVGNVKVAKIAYKYEVDLRTPRKMRYVLIVDFDANDQQIGNPSYHSGNWASVSGRKATILALSYAKEGQDTKAIPAPVSDR
jgi:hypothetical protein